MKERITEDWTFKDFPDELDLKDVAYILDISPQTVSRLQESKELLVNSGRINKQDLLDFIERHFIVNVPAFSIEENLNAFVDKNNGLPAVLNQDSLIYIMNEIPERIKGFPGYNNGTISRENFVKYLYEIEGITDIELALNKPKKAR